MARSCSVGMLRGRFLPFFLGMYTRFRAQGWYPRCFRPLMALFLFGGVFQITPSTPAVFLPGFSVTRLTAIALPENEWVSRCCKALTLPHLPSFLAFTRVNARREAGGAQRAGPWALAADARSLEPSANQWQSSSLLYGKPHPQYCTPLPSSACFLSRFLKLSREGRPVGSLLAFASGDVSPRIRAIAARHWLAPTSFTRIPIGLPCGRLSSFEERYGLTMFHRDDNDALGSLMPPEGLLAHDKAGRDLVPPS